MLLRFVLIIILFIVLSIGVAAKTHAGELEHQPWWSFQSIDTMKYSRDLSREKLSDPSFDVVIDQQIAQIAHTGATHVSIATPYDAEFEPILRRWVSIARAHGLKIWFRGNWSGWEEWFDYPKISRAQHLSKTKEFILSNPDLFEAGDVFSACPECENGGPGDPRQNGDAAGHRQFLIDEHKMMDDAFAEIDVDVNYSFNSMNGDVARLIMDRPTTKALGGYIVVDHYVDKPEQLAEDVAEYGRLSGGKVILGEFGAPIPDIHGRMSDAQQAEWLEETMSLLIEEPALAGMNYWTGVGGSTQIWNSAGEAEPSVEVLRSYYTPKLLSGAVFTKEGDSVVGAKVTSLDKSVISQEDGTFELPYYQTMGNLVITSEGYHDLVMAFPSDPTRIVAVEMQPLETSSLQSVWQRLINYIKKILSI